jgi:diguanylate cyclase (GGDEF)-like protein
LFFGSRGSDSDGTGQSILDIWPEISEFWQPALAASESGKQLRVDIAAVDREGRSLVLDVRLFLTGGHDTTSNSVAVVARDVTADRDHVRNLEIQATTDPLTGAYNRNQLEVLLTQAMRSAKRRKTTGCLLFLDIDGFKKINDMYGHDEGDQTLKTFVSVLKENLRASDVIARFGGDEFGAVLADSDLESGLAKAQQLVDALAKLKSADNSEGIVVSIGLAVFPGHGDYASDIIKSADVAMYRAKRHPGRTVMAWEAGWTE